MTAKKKKQEEDFDLTLEDLLDSIPIGLYAMDNEGKIKVFNRAQEGFSKIDRKKVIGTYYHETFCEVMKQDDRYNRFMELLKHRKPFAAVFHNLIPQFHSTPLAGKSYGVPLRSGKGVLIATDFVEEINKDKLALQLLNTQLTESSSFLQNLLDSSPNSVIVTDNEGFIRTSNKTAEKIFGYSKEDLMWRHMSVLMVDPIENSKLDTLIDLQKSSEFNLKKKDEQVFPARVRLALLASKDKDLPSRLFIIEDISYEKSIEFSLSERLSFETLLSELFSTFVNVNHSELDDRINFAFQKIGETLNIDRCCLALFDSTRANFQITHAWNTKSVQPIEAGTSSENFPWLFSELAKDTVVHFEHLHELPDDAGTDKTNYLKLGTKSQLTIPLLDDGKMTGCFALDQVTFARKWSPELINRLQILAEVLQNVLLKKRSEQSLEKAYLEINQLKEQLENERNYLCEEIKIEHNYESIIGESQALKYALYKVEQVAPTDSTVLLLGETGTGKELLARAIHSKSKRKNQPLIKVNCATLQSNLIESELFGHEKGAFTGAQTARKGRFELSNNGTLFLDEIGELPLETQSKLLRVLQEGEFERLGSSVTIKVDVRIIAATNRNLPEEVSAGRFRSDLWYRLNVFPVTSPPLRLRKEDIPLLTNYLIDRFNRKMGKQIDHISSKSLRILEAYSWPGNVRELENVVERAVINAHDNILSIEETLLSDLAPIQPAEETKSLAEIERSRIIKAMEQARWRIDGKKGAAVILGLTPSSLRRRLVKYNIQRP